MGLGIKQIIFFAADVRNRTLLQCGVSHLLLGPSDSPTSATLSDERIIWKIMEVEHTTYVGCSHWLNIGSANAPVSPVDPVGVSTLKCSH